MKEIQLRDYQEKFNAEVLQELDAGHKVCGVAPCGAGKTVMAAAMVKDAVNRGERVVFMVHRKELVEQTADTFKNFGIPFGLVLSGRKTNYELPVQIASVPTLANRLGEVPPPDFLICDECHHILAETYKGIVAEWGNARLLGITATPVRYGGIRLGDVFDTIVKAPETQDLIQMGYLSNFHCYSGGINLHLERLKIQNGDYINRDLSKVMSEGRITGNIVQHYLKRAKGTQAICYCVNIAHSKLVADEFQRAGIIAEQVDGKTPKRKRAALIDAFRRGNIQILCNAELFGEGFDVPNVHTVILARPTLSLALFIQQAMRPLRPDPNDANKIAVILDHAQNVNRFDLPDIARRWSLEPNKKREKNPFTEANEGDGLKICPKCGLFVPAATAICPECDYEFYDFSETEEELIEIPRTPYVPPEIREINIWRDRIREWNSTANRRGYQKGWKFYQVLKYVNSYSDCLVVVKLQKDLDEPIINVFGTDENCAKWLWNKAQEQRH